MTELRDRVFAATGLRSAAHRLRREAADYRGDAQANQAHGSSEAAAFSVVRARMLEAFAAIFEGEAEGMVLGVLVPGLDPDWLASLGVTESMIASR